MEGAVGRLLAAGSWRTNRCWSAIRRDKGDVREPADRQPSWGEYLGLVLDLAHAAEVGAVPRMAHGLGPKLTLRQRQEMGRAAPRQAQCGEFQPGTTRPQGQAVRCDDRISGDRSPPAHSIDVDPTRQRRSAEVELGRHPRQARASLGLPNRGQTA